MQSKANVSIGALAGMRQSGLCIMRESGYDFLSTDSYATLDAKFHALFPKLYDYFGEQDITDGSESLASWLICMKLPHKQGIVVFSDDQELPTGFDIMQACRMSKSKAGINERTLYLGEFLKHCIYFYLLI